MKVTMLRWKLFWRKRGKVGNDTFFYMIFCLNMLVCFSAEMCQYSCLDNGVCEVLYTGPPRYVRKCIARDYKGWLVSRPIWVSAYLTVLRDRTRYRIGWIFEKIQTAFDLLYYLWLTPSSALKIWFTYKQAYMPYESSEDSSHLPDGGWPRPPKWTAWDP